MQCEMKAQPANLWYVAATLIPGNSGSPIFRLPPGNAALRFGDSRVFLLGVQSAAVVAGEIAGLTPSSLVFEIIESLKLPDANLDRGPAKATESASK
jgi:hypothetical protein